VKSGNLLRKVHYRTVRGFTW